MNINFHYYAVKAIAHSAGFPADKAQLIAEYSQFVDDYTMGGYVIISNPGTPGYNAANGLHLIRGTAEKPMIDSVQTGFAGLDYMRMLAKKFQNKTVVPFHFIPAVQLNEHNYHTTTVPAHLNDGSVISAALNHVMGQCRGDECRDPRNLIQLGTLLHVFADTYAHQRFNGHWDGFFENSYNCYTVQRVLKNRGYGTPDPDDRENITGKYGSIWYRALPAIGHGTVGHAPDDTDITITLRFCDNARDDYMRNNTDVFAEASREIYRCLFWCRTGTFPAEENWNALRDRLLRGFLVRNGTDPTDEMRAAWTAAFPECDFTYEKRTIMNRIFGRVMAVEFVDKDVNTAVSSDVSGIYDLLLDKEIVRMTAAVTDEFYWFTIGAHTIRSQAVAAGFLN